MACILFSTNSLPGICADWTQLRDFEQTTPIADLLQEIQAEGVPTTEDQVFFSCPLQHITQCHVTGM